MTSTIAFCGQTKDYTNKNSRSHRIDVHRHADQTIAELEAKSRLNSVKKPNTPSVFVKYCQNFARGLEGMFSAIHVRP